MAINILKSCKSVFAYVKNPIPYKVIIPLAPSPGRNPGSAPDDSDVMQVSLVSKAVLYFKNTDVTKYFFSAQLISEAGLSRS